MSRFDYPDPGEDRNYCDALAPDCPFDPRDPAVIDRERPDPAALAEQAILANLTAIDTELAKCQTEQRAWELFELMIRLSRFLESTMTRARAKPSDFYQGA